MTRAATVFIHPGPGARIVETNFGDGAYTEVFLAMQPTARIIAFELDPEAIARGRAFLGEAGSAQVEVIPDSFGNLESQLGPRGLMGEIDYVFCDPGLSLSQATGVRGGFSFQTDAPLQMTYDPAAARSAADLVNALSEAELTATFTLCDIPLREARAVAAEIADTRARGRIATTTQLVDCIVRALGRAREGKRHVATRYFLALRLATTGELFELERGLPQMLRALKVGGVGVLLSYHGLESRLMRDFLNSYKRPHESRPDGPRLEVLTPHPVKPDREEVRRNPRSRSALLRAFRRTV